jgi:tetratricopeptide (TPR) repeat protein
MLLFDTIRAPERHDFARSRSVRPYLVVAAVLVLYLGARSQATFPADQMALSSAPPPPLVSRLLTFPQSLVEYVVLLVAPVHLHMQRVAPPLQHYVQADVLAPLALVVLSVWWIVRLLRARNRIGFWLAWFLLLLLPVSDTVLPLNATMAEHWLYVPSVGFIAAGVLLAAGPLKRCSTAWRRSGTAVLACYVLLLGMRTIARNRDWRDNLSIWSHTARYADTSHIHGNLAVLYWGQGNIARAEAELRRALALQENYPEAHYNLGRIHMSRGEYRQAEHEFRKALQYRPNYRNAQRWLNEAMRAPRAGGTTDGHDAARRQPE